jgi:quinol monooxygenase YgiN
MRPGVNYAAGAHFAVANAARKSACHAELFGPAMAATGGSMLSAMIFIVVKFETKPEWTDRWPELVASFTAATRAEDGNLWFEWSRSLDNPAEYVLVEAFRDGDAGGAHVNSDHFKRAMQELPQALKSTPKIISQTLDATGWSAMGEMSVD